MFGEVTSWPSPQVQGWRSPNHSQADHKSQKHDMHKLITVIQYEIYLQNVPFMAFLLSGLLSSTWITCSCGLVTARVSNLYCSVLFILVFELWIALLWDANKTFSGFSDMHVFDRRPLIPKTKEKRHHEISVEANWRWYQCTYKCL